MTPEPFLPKPVADLGDTIVDAILDLVDLEPDDVKDRVYAAIREGQYVETRQPGDPRVPTDAGLVLVRFPGIGREYAVPLVRIGDQRRRLS